MPWFKWTWNQTKMGIMNKYKHYPEIRPIATHTVQAVQASMLTEP